MNFAKKPPAETQVPHRSPANSQFRSSNLSVDADLSITSEWVVRAAFVRIAKQRDRCGFRQNLLHGSCRAFPELQFPDQGWSWVGHQKTEQLDHCRHDSPVGWRPLPALAQG
jgi:hypothetical protein